MIYALFDDGGLLQAFYDTRVHAAIPQGAVEITGEQYADLMAAPRGWQLAGTAIVPLEAGAPTKAELVAYANARQWAIATDGYTVTIGGVARRFETDGTSFSLLNGKALRLSQPNPPTEVNWQFGDELVSIPATDFLEAATAIADFIQGTFDALGPVFAGISAGSITTTAEIDTALVGIN